MLDSLLHPKSIAVIGVSLDPSKVGHQVYANLHAFSGPVYPVHPTNGEIAGKRCYPDILSIPHPVDLAVITTPLSTVEDVIRQCIDKKVGSIICISAGFAERGKEGKALQERIAQTLSQNNILLLGPNTLGAINTYENLNASFAPAHIAKGSIALISQSGALLTTIFSQFSSRNVGCSFALSLGNSAGVSITDALLYAKDDPQTHVIGIYAESIPNMDEFFALCKEVSATKPIILLKGGTTSAGESASLSHTAALATDSTLLAAGQYQFGFCYVETLEQWFETLYTADYLSGGKLPESLMILTNAGGPGVNAVDLATKAKLHLASWKSSSVEAFARQLPRVKPSNPTDLIGDASVEDFKTALDIAANDPLIESILLIVTPQAVTDVPGIVALLLKRQKTPSKPLIVALMVGENYRKEIQALRSNGITTVEYANEGVEIFAHIENIRKAQYIDRSARLLHAIHASLHPTKIHPPANLSRRAFPITSSKLAHIYLLLEDYGFVLPHCAIVSDRKKLDELDELDPTTVYPLIAKTANLGIKHKAIVGGVVSDITNKQQAIDAYTRLQKFGEEVLFQEVIENGIEVILGCRRDPSFGEYLAVGSGGSLTNILADRSYVFLPAGKKELRACLDRTKLVSLLSPEQHAHVLLAMEQCASLLMEHKNVTELEINPLLVTKHIAYVADVKISLSVVG